MTSNRKSTRYYSHRQESKVAKSLNGKTVPNSGAPRFLGGDVVLDDWLIEAKTCTSLKKSFSIKKEWFDKNRKESLAMGKSYSALVFDFGDGEQHYIINERLFKKLINYLKEEENNE